MIFLACLFIRTAFNIFAYGMHMHIKLMKTFGNWLIVYSGLNVTWNKPFR